MDNTDCLEALDDERIALGWDCECDCLTGKCLCWEPCLWDPELGSFVYTPNDELCDDDISCTIDDCDPLFGCIYIPDDDYCDDDISCTDDYCDRNRGCINDEDDDYCDDGIFCTIDICDRRKGCINKEDDSLCEGGSADGNECADPDICDRRKDCIASPKPA